MLQYGYRVSLLLKMDRNVSNLNTKDMKPYFDVLSVRTAIIWHNEWCLSHAKVVSSTAQSVYKENKLMIW